MSGKRMSDTTTTAPTYHDLHITTPSIARTSVFDLPYGIEVRCTRVGGWSVWSRPMSGEPFLVGGEYDVERWLVLDVAGHIIVSSRPPETTTDA